MVETTDDTARRATYIRKNYGRKIKLMVISVLALVFLTRFAFVTVYRNGDFAPNDRVSSWNRIASNLASGKGYTYGTEAPTARRGPVPVLFLAALFRLFGPRAFPVPIVISQWLFDMGSALLLYLISIELFDDRRVGFLAMVLFALHPLIIENSATPHVEPLSTFLLLGFVLTFLRALRARQWFRFFWPGVLLGLGILSLAVLQFFPVLAIGLILAALRKDRRRALAATATFCLALAIVWMPWIVRNYLALGTVVPASTLGGHSLLRDHLTLAEPDYLRFRLTVENTADQKELLLEKSAELGSLSEVDRDRFFRDTALESIRSYPHRYLALSGVRFFRFWFGQGLGLGPSRPGYVGVTVNGALFLLALTAYLWFGDDWMRPSVVLLALLAYGTAQYMAVVADLRYSIPFVPLLILPSAYGLGRLLLKVVGQINARNTATL